MKAQFSIFLGYFLNSVRDLAFIAAVIAFFQQPIPNLGEILGGVLLVMLGLTFFIRGLEMGLFPLGESMAYAFARKGSVFCLLLFAFISLFERLKLSRAPVTDNGQIGGCSEPHMNDLTLNKEVSFAD